MNTPNTVLMRQARESLRGKWGTAVEVSIILFVIMILIEIIPVFGTIVRLIIAGPIVLGSAMVWLAFARNQQIKLTMIFDGFKYFANAFVAFILMVIFIVLWSLLLIVPGIIASFAYSMTFFILADDPTLDAREAIRRSKEMMKGNKWKFAYLSFNFIGWSLVAMLTFGIGFLWLVPYMKVSIAKFYEDIKGAVSEEADIVVASEAEANTATS